MKNGACQNFLPFFSAVLLILLNASAIAAPSLSNIETKNLDYPAGSGKIAITKSISVRADSRYLKSATIRIVSGYNRMQDVLSFKNTNSISGSWDANSGILTLTGVASVSSYQNALRAVTYENLNKVNPSAEIRNVTFTVTDIWGVVSNTVSRNINIIVPNAAPVLYNIETDPVIWCYNTDSTLITSGISIRDSNDIELSSATVRIATGYVQNEDFLIYTNRDNIIGSWNSVSGILTLTGVATLNQYTQALRSVQYRNINTENPVALYHQIIFRVSDGKTLSNEAGRSIVHVIPTASVAGSDSICAGQTSSISISFTGTAPWKFSYAADGGTQMLVENVNESPVQITVNSAGIYQLTAMSDKFCPGKFSGTAEIIRLPGPDVTITGLEPAYSQQSTEWIPLHGVPDGGDFSGSGVLPYGNDWYFIPSLPSVGLHDIIYSYRISEESCFGYDTATVRILENSSAIETEGNRTHFCNNDAPFKVTGINLINHETGSFTITGGNGLTDHGNNTATIYPSQLQINHYDITYTAFDGTSVSVEIEVGSDLVADFNWETECFQQGEPVRFSNQTYSPFGWLDDESYLWTIIGNDDTATSENIDFVHTFDQPGVYRVALKATNTYGCINEQEKIFSLNSVIPLSEQNYFEDFENQRAWHTQNDVSYPVNSWVLGSSESFKPYNEGEQFWYTNITQAPAPREHSWISSPCFDFRGVEKPTLVARIHRSFVNSRDGSNLEYTTNDGQTWNPVGSILDGLNWFNTYFGIPGEQSEGWAAITDNDWVEARHILDFLIGEPKVQFRFNYFAFGNASGNKGIAIDDFEIVRRNRTILLEYFTNSSCNECREADSLLNTVARQSGSNVIDIQYHSGNQDDPFYNDNPVIPTARQFYYSLTDIPYAIINGGSLASRRLDFHSGYPESKQMNVESLYDSDFNMEVVSMLDHDTLYAEVFVTSLKDLPLSELAVRMVVIEPVIDNIAGQNGTIEFRNVVKTMLPDAAGTVLYKSWNRNESISLRQAWPMQNVYHSESLRVVGFLQDENSREVYQASLDYRGIVSDNKQLFRDPESARVFPNPARDRFYIETTYNHRKITFELYNSTGTLVLSQNNSDPAARKEVDVSFLTPGIYLLRVTCDHIKPLITPIIIY